MTKSGETVRQILFRESKLVLITGQNAFELLTNLDNVKIQKAVRQDLVEMVESFGSWVKNSGIKSVVARVAGVTIYHCDYLARQLLEEWLKLDELKDYEQIAVTNLQNLVETSRSLLEHDMSRVEPNPEDPQSAVLINLSQPWYCMNNTLRVLGKIQKRRSELKNEN